MLLRIKKKDQYKDLPTPQFMTSGSVGMDLYAAIDENLILKPMERKLISTGIYIKIPRGYEAQIRPRSGLAIKYGITLLNTPGTIDWDYRGEIKVIVINFGENDFTIKKGDRIAQMVFNKVVIPLVEEVDYIEDTERGSNGFGSTGD